RESLSFNEKLKPGTIKKRTCKEDCEGIVVNT
ncbi:MAG: hypothetical protein ACJAQ2_001411, partial [Vicingaceae bacterium]